VDDIEYIFTVSWNFKKFIFLIKNLWEQGNFVIWDKVRGEKNSEETCAALKEIMKNEILCCSFCLGTRLKQKIERMN
jgi:hypothetical protein